MTKILLGIPFALVITLIIRAEGTFSVFTVWNCLPVAVAYGALLISFRLRGPLTAAAITFSIISTVLPTIFHLAWLFDWSGTATGSSTSALAFIFVPLWTFILAVVATGIAWIIAHLIQRLGGLKSK